MSAGQARRTCVGSVTETTGPEGLLEADEPRLVFGLPPDSAGNTGILVFVCRLSKMVHLAPVRDTVMGKQAARLFLDGFLRHHGLSEAIVSDRDPRFTAAFW